MKAVDPIEPGTCGALTRKGSPCRKPEGAGTSHHGTGRCKLHGGASPQAELSGQVLLARREAAVMGVPLDIEPHNAILECIRIAAGEVQYASEQIAALDPADAVLPLTSTLTRPLKEEKGAEDPMILVEEITVTQPALHVWIVTRRDAMDRLVKYSAVALKAGVQQRLVELAEGQAQLLADAMRRFAQALGFEPADPKVREAMRGSLTLIQGGQRAA